MRVEGSAPRLDVADRAPLPVWSVAPLAGPSGSLIAGWKDGARRDLDTWMARAARRAAAEVARDTTLPARVAVVAAPSRRSSVRRRGVDLPRVLAGGAAAGLRDVGLAARAAPALVIGAGESRGSSARGRWRDARRSVRVRRAPAAPVLLVDDVVTTGATLAACAAALERAGAEVIGALVATHVDTGRAGPPSGLG